MCNTFASQLTRYALDVLEITGVGIRQRLQDATAQMAKAGGATRSGAAAEEKTGEEEKMASSDGQVSWAPDPRTGCYRPDNCIEEIDVAELRAKHLRLKE
ncbi:hypothetical protein ACJRO7_009114 [Eucalyptus globulus]|uniref:Uncharacterized protein n=1 Tax=Eucalyptus globulus TaxID=34317 RepID=A0ABD3IU24_EUCGL